MGKSCTNQASINYLKTQRKFYIEKINCLIVLSIEIAWGPTVNHHKRFVTQHSYVAYQELPGISKTVTSGAESLDKGKDLNIQIQTTVLYHIRQVDVQSIKQTRISDTQSDDSPSRNSHCPCALKQAKHTRPLSKFAQSYKSVNVEE